MIKKLNKVAKLEYIEPVQNHKSWGFLQTFLEFIIYCIASEIFTGFSEIIISIYLLWTISRLLNFVGLTKLFGNRFERFFTLKTSFNIPKFNYISWISRPISWIRKLLSNHFKDYFNFTGKINRNDYFRKICFHFLDVIPLILLTEFLNLPSQLIGLIIISFLSLSSRRMRDVGKSPFWLIIFSLITILAFVNDIFILIAFPFLFILVFWLIKPSLKVGNIFE